MSSRQEPPVDGRVQPVVMSWTIKQIIYICAASPFLLIAATEWALHLFFFLYCFLKVLQKAKGKYSIWILGVLNIAFMVAMRCVFLLVMFVTLPLPPLILLYLPQPLTTLLTDFALWSFAALLDIPALVCIWQLVTHQVGRERMIKYLLDERTAPKVVIIMPCFNEEPQILLRTVDSIVDCEYPPSCMHVFLSFDGDRIEGLFVDTLEQLGVPVPLVSYADSIDFQYRGCRVTVSRFPHGGKRNCQKLTYRVVEKVYAQYLRKHDDLFMLFIDSDCILDKYCIQNFMYEMELKPGSEHKMNAMTGVITSTTDSKNIWTLLQDMEYIHGQMFERSVESACGAVTCLPGALTMLRFSAFMNMSKYYFADNFAHCDDAFDYSKCHLGEDRWLTHLFMVGATSRYQIQMNPGAFCKTEAVQTFKSLVKQRRRWFLGFITNEACMLTDYRLWWRYPLVLILRLSQNTIRTTALLFWMMMFSVVTTEQSIKRLPLEFIAFSLSLNWSLMVYLAFKLHRYKLIAYPLMFLINPVLNLAYMLQAILTARQRTWGGPRADAETADVTVSPLQPAAQAETNGETFNTLPSEALGLDETAPGQDSRGPMPLMPSSHLEGRFAAGVIARTNAGWFDTANGLFNRIFNAGSTASIASALSAYQPVPTPKRVESLMNPEGVSTYRNHQVEQEPAGGAFLESSKGKRTGPESDRDPLLQYEETARAQSVDSDSTVSLHFSIPQRDPAELFKTRNDPQRDLLPPPSTVYRPSERRHQTPRSSTLRTGRSPLARKSFEWVADDDALLECEMEDVELNDLNHERDSSGGEGHEHKTKSRPKKLQKRQNG